MSVVAIRRSDLPECFIKQFRPAVVDPRERGLPRYLFDRFGLDFFRDMATANAVPSSAIWSVVHWSPLSQLRLVMGEDPEAVGYIVADVSRSPEESRLWILPKRLSYREKVQLATLRTLLLDLRAAAMSPDEVIEFIESKLDPQQE